MIQSIMKGEDFSTLIGSRKLYIWGSGHLGVSIRYAMSRLGVEITGFMDSNMSGATFLGYQIKNPKDILSGGKDNAFIILSSLLFSNEMVRYCDEYGFYHSKDYLTHADIMPNIEIDVAGCCNLRCLTCPRGNSAAGPAAGMMSFDSFKKVIDKLILEIPILSNVQLYSWGEPLLNPEISKMISYASSKGIASTLSSNLSLNCDLEPVVKSIPAWFRVSLSGADHKTYSQIHRRGNLDLVVGNLRRLSKLRSQFAKTMFVEVNYHLYKHNLDGVKKMEQLCRNLDFAFKINYAYIDPLDSIIEYSMGITLPHQMEKGRQYLLLDIDDAIKHSQESEAHDCVSENCFVIHSDMSFRRCNHIYRDSSNIIADNFLKMPLDEILICAENCEICNTCRSLGVHRFHYPYINKSIQIKELQ